MAVKSIETEALRLLKHPGITLAIDHYRRNRAMETMLSFEQHMAKLRELRDTATANGKLGAAVRAEYLRGKAAGLYDRLEHSAVNEFARMSDEELRQVIVDQAKAIEALGIDLLPAPKAKKH
jgi:hypothetical protein